MSSYILHSLVFLLSFTVPESGDLVSCFIKTKEFGLGEPPVEEFLPFYTMCLFILFRNLLNRFSFK